MVTATLALVEVELIKGKPTVVAIGSRDALNDTYQRLKLMAKLERELGGTMRCRTLHQWKGGEEVDATLLVGGRRGTTVGSSAGHGGGEMAEVQWR